MMLQLLLQDTLEAEMNGAVIAEIKPNKGEIHDVSFRTDRVKNDKLEYYLRKTEEEFPGFLQDIWENANLVVVNLDPEGGPARISIAKKESRSQDLPDGENKQKIRPSFVVMDLDDFFRMTSIKDVNNGDSRIKTPDVRSDNLTDWKNLVLAIESIHSNGKPIGNLEHPAVIIKTKKEDETVIRLRNEDINATREYLLKEATGQKPWQENNLTGTAFDKPTWPEKVKSAPSKDVNQRDIWKGTRRDW